MAACVSTDHHSNASSSSERRHERVALNPNSPEFVPGEENSRDHSQERFRGFPTRIFVNSNRKTANLSAAAAANDSGGGRGSRRGGRPPFARSSHQAPATGQHEVYQPWDSPSAESQLQPWIPPPSSLPLSDHTSGRRGRGRYRGGGGGSFRGPKSRGGPPRYLEDYGRSQQEDQHGGSPRNQFVAPRHASSRQNGDSSQERRGGSYGGPPNRKFPRSRPPFTQRNRGDQGGDRPRRNNRNEKRTETSPPSQTKSDQVPSPPPGVDYSPQDWRAHHSPPKSLQPDDKPELEQTDDTTAEPKDSQSEEPSKTEEEAHPQAECIQKSEIAEDVSSDFQGHVEDWAREASTEDSSLQETESHPLPEEEPQNNTSQSLEDTGLHTSPEPDQHLGEAISPSPDPEAQPIGDDRTTEGKNEEVDEITASSPLPSGDAPVTEETPPSTPSDSATTTTKSSPQSKKKKKPDSSRTSDSPKEQQRDEAAVAAARKNCRLQGKFSDPPPHGRSHKKLHYVPLQPQNTGFIYHSTGNTQPLDEAKPTETKLLEFEGEYILSEHKEGVSKLVYLPQLFPEEEATSLLNQLLNEVKWEQRDVMIRGVSRPQPRLVAWFGPLPYGYTGLTLQPQEKAPGAVELIQKRVEEATHSTFNSVLLNLYKTGQHSVGWHSDDEMELGVHPHIASVSLGEARRFELRPKPHYKGAVEPSTEPTHRILLGHGSLIVMDGVMQAHWLHRVPKESHIQKPRINLTFRTVFDTKR